MNATPTIQSLQHLIEQIRGGGPLRKALTSHTRFVEDLGMASLELIALVYLCEQTFSVSLTELSGLIEKLHTVGQSVAAIAGLQAGVASVS